MYDVKRDQICKSGRHKAYGADCRGNGCILLGACRSAACTAKNVYLEADKMVLRSDITSSATISGKVTTGAVTVFRKTLSKLPTTRVHQSNRKSFRHGTGHPGGQAKAPSEVYLARISAGCVDITAYIVRIWMYSGRAFELDC